jgi:hypothetical protein
LLHEKAKALGIPSVIHGGGRNDLPKINGGKTWLELQLEFCRKHLSEKVAN